MSEQERFYDEVIAPALLDLRNQCAERDMPFLAVVEWAPNEYGRTEFHPAGERSASMALASLAARSQGNYDTLSIAVQRHAVEHGHNSLVLRVLGIPSTPADTPDPA